MEKQSKKYLSVIYLLVAVILVGGGIYLVAHKSGSKAANTYSQTQSSSTPPSHSAPNTITFNGNTFNPATLSVKSGTSVTIKNASAQDLQMDSDPHPVHTDDTDLNVGQVSAGQNQIFTVTKTGSFGYHDHLNPGIKGKITIE